MLVDIHNPQQALSHVVLANTELAKALSETELWKQEAKLEAKLTVNGLEIPVQLLEDVMQDLYKRATAEIEDKYGKPDIDAMVEEKAEQLLKEHADNALEKINNLVELLEAPIDLLKPYWERK